jgi:UDP-N-acetylmuramoyl-tripeptide--D-alanyl-D-alanine ligase
MARHMQIVQPDIGILTSIGEEHLEQLKDVDTVFEEESKLFEETWKRGGTCFAPRADKYLIQHGAHPLTFLTPETPQELNPQWKSSLEHPLALRNAALAAKVAQFLGLDAAKITQGLAHLQLPEGRGRTWSNSRNQDVIADHYNSNPASLRAGFLYLKTLGGSSKLYLVLGDMLELGPQSLNFHKELLKEALLLKPKGLCLVGPQFAEALKSIDTKSETSQIVNALNADEARDKISSWVSQEGRFFFKGSRGMRLEKVLEQFM